MSEYLISAHFSYIELNSWENNRIIKQLFKLENADYDFSTGDMVIDGEEICENFTGRSDIKELVIDYLNSLDENECKSILQDNYGIAVNEYETLDNAINNLNDSLYFAIYDEQILNNIEKLDIYDSTGNQAFNEFTNDLKDDVSRSIKSANRLCAKEIESILEQSQNIKLIKAEKVTNGFYSYQVEADNENVVNDLKILLDYETNKLFARNIGNLLTEHEFVDMNDIVLVRAIPDVNINEDGNIDIHIRKVEI